MTSLLKRWQPRAVALQRASWTDRMLLMECAVLLALTRAAVLLLPFRWLAARMGQLNAESVRQMDPQAQRRADFLGQRIERISRHTWWNSNCFAQALTAYIMLRRRGLAGTMMLGVCTDRDSGELKGHAWLRSGEHIVTGAPQHREYHCVATFAWGHIEKDDRRQPARQKDKAE